MLVSLVNPTELQNRLRPTGTAVWLNGSASLDGLGRPTAMVSRMLTPLKTQRIWEEIRTIATSLLRSCFADSVLMDQPLIPDWMPASESADEWTDKVRSILASFEVTHQWLSKHLIDIEDYHARCEVDISAVHQIGGYGSPRTCMAGGYVQKVGPPIELLQPRARGPGMGCAAPGPDWRKDFAPKAMELIVKLTSAA